LRSKGSRERKPIAPTHHPPRNPRPNSFHPPAFNPTYMNPHYESRHESARVHRFSRRPRMAGVVGSASDRPQASPRKLRLGFDNFSIRDFKWKAPQLIDYAASLKVENPAVIRSRRLREPRAGLLEGIRARRTRPGSNCTWAPAAFVPPPPPTTRSAGVLRSSTRGCCCARRSSLGSPVARCYLGSRRDREGDGGIYPHIEATVKVLKALQGEAEQAGVKFAVENHAGDMQAWELAD
jgi:3-oxoisoapionate decarboxylase